MPGDTEAQAVGEIQAIVDRLSAARSRFHAEVRPFFVRDPFEVSALARGSSETVDRAAAKVRGRAAAKHIGDTPWMDAALLQAAGVETVVCGAGGTGAHAESNGWMWNRWCSLAEILAEAAESITAPEAKQHLTRACTARPSPCRLSATRPRASSGSSTAAAWNASSSPRPITSASS